MKIIDVHAHIYPQKIEEKATEAIRAFYDCPKMKYSGSSGQLIASGEKAGITKYLVFSTATTAKQVESIDNFILGECAAHPEFVGLGTLHTDYENYAEELKRIDEAGMHGVKLHPDFQKFDFDDPRLMPMYDVLDQLGMFVITHAGDYRYPYSHPERVAHVAREFPHLKIIAAHFGGWSVWDLAIPLLKDLPNVYYDTSSTIGFGSEEPARKGFAAYDNTHLFFGSDFPMWDHAEELERLQRITGDGQLFEDVCWNNFAAFYGREL